MKINFVSDTKLGYRKDSVLTAVVSAGGVAALVLGTLVDSGQGSVLSMAGALLVLVRALLGASPNAHARRAQIARELAHARRDRIERARAVSSAAAIGDASHDRSMSPRTLPYPVLVRSTTAQERSIAAQTVDRSLPAQADIMPSRA